MISKILMEPSKNPLIEQIPEYSCPMEFDNDVPGYSEGYLVEDPATHRIWFISEDFEVDMELPEAIVTKAQAVVFMNHFDSE